MDLVTMEHLTQTRFTRDGAASLRMSKAAKKQRRRRAARKRKRRARMLAMQWDGQGTG